MHYSLIDGLTGNFTASIAILKEDTVVERIKSGDRHLRRLARNVIEDVSKRPLGFTCAAPNAVFPADKDVEHFLKTNVERFLKPFKAIGEARAFVKKHLDANSSCSDFVTVEFKGANLAIA